MDAISFVLGEKTSNLRVKSVKVSPLITKRFKLSWLGIIKLQFNNILNIPQVFTK